MIEPTQTRQPMPAIFKKSVLTVALLTIASMSVQSEISATHIYHSHMPNFWPYYDISSYDNAALGSPIRYMYDGQVKELKNNPPSNYTFYIPGSGLPMPHDDIESYYSHHAKTGAYLSWPMDTALSNNGNHPLSQTQVTMSASVINNVQSFAELGNQSGYNLGWGDYWKNTQQSTKTSSGEKALDTIHFAGHHTMGPLVGNDYFLKDLIYQNITLAQPYFLGDSFTSSKGFFPTELGFSERIIPALTKLGIEWSVLGNVHYSRTLKDYPYLNDPGVDTLVSPPNRADLQNESNVGDWVALHMFNEQQVTQNKFPFASIPHYVQYIDPETAEAHKVAGIPVEQASSWEEGYQGSVTADALKPFEADAAALGRTQYFVVAHDGDNSSGRAGDGGTWAASGNVTYADSGVTGKGVAEYLKAHPIPVNDIVHVQDGSWIDTRDSSADPTWYHWHLPMGVWATQLSAFNTVNGTDYPELFAANGSKRNHMPSLELGYHYLERNFALLQAAENYAKTAEQIWLDDHPNHWQPSNALDFEVTYPGNQLNPWMMSYPVKGDAQNDYSGGANPAELSWYFLLASIDSGFGYYDENVDDGVKPTLSFNQSLHFSKPYVAQNLAKDRTGPSLWWPQRYPYNPGSVNNSKAEGWATMYMNNSFAIYTYGYDVSDISNIQVKVRTHSAKRADPLDKTYQLYDPAAHASDPNVDPSRVSAWTSVDMTQRDLSADINGVEWQAASTEVFEVVPASEIGDLYYAYFDDYEDQLLDYYIEATDSKGNVTKSDIQQVYVGTGRYSMEGGKQVEDANGSIEGEEPFFTRYGYNQRPTSKISPNEDQTVEAGTVVTLSAASSFDADGQIASYLWSTGETNEEIQVLVDQRKTISLKVTDNAGSSHTSSVSLRIIDDTSIATIYYQDTQSWGNVCIHYSTDGELTWTAAPGEATQSLANNWYSKSIDLDAGNDLVFVTNNCADTWDNNGGQNYQASEGDWNISNGNLVAGVPTDITDNQRPIARLLPASQSVAYGTNVTFDASTSSDSDGQIVSYLWSTAETTPQIQTTIYQYTEVSVTVTDNDGAADSATVIIDVIVNQPPTAVIQPGSSSYASDTVVTLSASASNDAEGDISDYLWSTGQTSEEIQLTLTADTTVSLSVYDSEGLMDSTSVTLTVDDSFAQNFNDLYFRGTPNGWNTQAMVLVADHIWQTTVVFDGQTNQRFKFDRFGDWTQSYGDDNNDGTAENGADDIYSSLTGEYKVSFNDANFNYSLERIDGSDFISELPSLSFRGTANAWSASAMTLVADNTWQITIDFDGQNNQRFKFDALGDWSQNFGDSNNDNYLEPNGNDIYFTNSGRFLITVNDLTNAYGIANQ